MTPLGQLALVSLWSGLLAVDRRAFLQSMLSRPLIASVSTGLILGQVEVGLCIGVVLEWFFLGVVSLGAAMHEHETFAAVSATVVGCRAAGHLPIHASCVFAILLCLLLAKVGRWAERAVDALSLRREALAQQAVKAGNLTLASKLNARGFLPPLLVYALMTWGVSLLAQVAAPALQALPPRLLTALDRAFPVMAVVCAAMAVRFSNAKRGAWIGLVGAAALFGASYVR